MRLPCQCPYEKPHPCVKSFASFVCKRGDTQLNLCSRCTVSGDVKIARLYVESDIPALVELDANPAVAPDEMAVFLDDLGNMIGGISFLFSCYLEDLPYYSEGSC